MGVNRLGLAKRLDGHRVLLDTSALVAYFTQTERTHEVAVALVDDLVRSGTDPAVISPVTAMEILVVPLRSAPARVATVHDFIMNWPNLTLVDINLSVAQDAAALRATYKFGTADALIIATGISAQVGHLVTNDAQWRKKLMPLRDRVQVTMLQDYVN